MTDSGRVRPAYAAALHSPRPTHTAGPWRDPQRPHHRCSPPFRTRTSAHAAASHERRRIAARNFAGCHPFLVDILAAEGALELRGPEKKYAMLAGPEGAGGRPGV